MLIVFRDFTHPLELSMHIHRDLDSYNKEVANDDKTFTRIGIGTGSYKTLSIKVLVKISNIVISYCSQESASYM